MRRYTAQFRKWPIAILKYFLLKPVFYAREQVDISCGAVL